MKKYNNIYIDKYEKPDGLITKDHICYEAFTENGWTWGGDWRSIKDYQHFEK